ncbi:hypothetical protein GGI15_003855 [Coemansia interrupta]|uniref:Uncharacterized protein n=1 Tax=Coemansia interrupta TaxID=1126814 RepID=A0A9W8HAE2_9FUNG|nr:hypothetical protein GGI15_003855 [Coemansia interrupta]
MTGCVDAPLKTTNTAGCHRVPLKTTSMTGCANALLEIACRMPLCTAPRLPRLPGAIVHCSKTACRVPSCTVQDRLHLWLCRRARAYE